MNTSDITAVSSVTIAILAMVATFWQAHIARRHNKLMVRPFMEHRQERFPGKHVMISVINHGLGPAVYEDVFFTSPTCSQKLSVDDLLDKMVLAMKPGEATWTTNIFQGESLIPPGREMELLTLELSAADNENFEILTTLMDEITIHISYKCLYGEHSTYSHELRVK